MKKIVLTVICTLLIMLLALTAYIYSGAFNVSQLIPHKPVTYWMIRTIKDHSIKKRLKDIVVPSLNDSAMIIQGFLHYSEMCVICHGAPGIKPGDLTEGLYPRPPEFYGSDDMPDPDEAFWKIKNGLKLTSMPAFGPTHTDQMIWSITAFLLNRMNKMSPEEYQAWAKKYSENEIRTY
jgi:mono/diheme cytochrome c family protein